MLPVETHTQSTYDEKRQRNEQQQGRDGRARGDAGPTSIDRHRTGPHHEIGGEDKLSVRTHTLAQIDDPKALRVSI